MPSSAAGRSALRLRYAQASHWPACLATCLRIGAAGGRGGQVGRLTEARFPRAQPAVALAAGHRVKPGPQPARIAKAAEAGGGDDERALNGIGGAVRPAQHPAAVTMQGLRVLVVSPG